MTLQQLEQGCLDLRMAAAGADLRIEDRDGQMGDRTELRQRRPPDARVEQLIVRVGGRHGVTVPAPTRQMKSRLETASVRAR